MGITGIPQTMEALALWSKEFEAKYSYYSEDNRRCTEANVNLHLKGLPKFLHGFGWKLAATLIEPDVRPCIGMEDPPAWLSAAILSILKFQGLLVRYTFLPRLKEMDVLGKVNDQGRVQRDRYLHEPWYVPETWWSMTLKKLLI